MRSALIVLALTFAAAVASLVFWGIRKGTRDTPVSDEKENLLQSAVPILENKTIFISSIINLLEKEGIKIERVNHATPDSTSHKGSTK